MKILHRFLAIYYLLVFLLLPAYGNLAAGQTDLKLNLKAGETYRLRTISDQVMTQTIRDQEHKMNQKTTMDMAYDVKGVDASGAITIRITIERLSSNTEVDGTKMTFDSEKPAENENPMAKVFGAMAGQSYTVVVTDRGAILELTGMDLIMKRVIESIDVPDENQRELLQKQFTQAFGEEQAMRNCKQMFGMLPPGPVNEGDNWTCSTSTTAFMPMTIEQTWTLKELKEDIAVLQGESVMKTQPEQGAMEMGTMKISIDMSLEQSCELELDRDTGMIMVGKMTSSASGEQKILEGPEQIKGQVIPLSMELTTTWQKL